MKVNAIPLPPGRTTRPRSIFSPLGIEACRAPELALTTSTFLASAPARLEEAATNAARHRNGPRMTSVQSQVARAGALRDGVRRNRQFHLGLLAALDRTIRRPEDPTGQHFEVPLVADRDIVVP